MGSTADKPLTAADLDALERSRTTNCGTCGGGGWRHPHCSRCDDSTDDHECPPPYLCPDCLGNGKTGCVEVRRETLTRLLAAAREAERLRAEVAMHKTNCAALWARLPHPLALVPPDVVCDFCGLSPEAHRESQEKVEKAEKAAQRACAARAMRPFPILGDKTRATIPWCVAEVAYEDYKRRFGDGQTLERIAERGGFCPLELIEHLGLKAAAERAAKEGK